MERILNQKMWGYGFNFMWGYLLKKAPETL